MGLSLSRQEDESALTTLCEPKRKRKIGTHIITDIHRQKQTHSQGHMKTGEHIGDIETDTHSCTDT